MATSKPQTAKSQTSTPVFASLKDAGFQQAGAYQTTESVAEFVMSKDPKFPDEVSEVTQTELKEGYKMKFNNIYKPINYAVINDHYVMASPEHLENDKIEKILIGVDYAFSYSSQEFGKLRNTKPALHKIVGEVREKTSTYCSNRFKELKKVAKDIIKARNGESKNDRKANLNFSEFVDEWFKDTAETRLKTAKSRGDATANVERFTNAKIAFMTKWKHADAK